MTTIWIRILLFLSSYFPLTVIFFFLYLQKAPSFACVSLGMGLLGLFGLVVYLLAARRLSPFQLKVTAVQRRDSEAMSYIVTYIIPFLALPADDRDKDLALIVFFGVLAVVYVNSQMIHINPMLNAVGFHLFQISTDDGSDAYVISRRRVRRGSTLKVISLTDDIFFERGI